VPRLPTLGLLLVSVIWGTTFVAVKAAMAHASPLLFVGVRFAAAAIAALPLLPRRSAGLRPAFWDSAPLGLVLAGAYCAQTIGLTTTTPARSAFITGLNVVLVPFWVLALRGARPSRFSIAGILVGLPGIWLLSSPEVGGWTRGDSWTVACAVLYALYVVLLSRAAERHATGALLFPQLLLTALVCLPASALLETPRFSPAPALWGALALTALLATMGTTWLQLRCQPHVGPTRSAVIYATEPIFAALFSFLLIGERLRPVAWAGGALILAGMLLSELGGAPRQKRMRTSRVEKR
jgi:drug/metabolite transporter (DMT)-like permease